MKMTPEDIEQLRSAFAICRVAGIDAAVVTDNQVRGLSPNAKMAIITPVNLTIDKEVKIGIGRIGEFDKRLQIFGGNISVDTKINDANEVSVMTLKSGKSTVQFRCTAERMIKYPKFNEDPEACTIIANKAEVAQIARAVKTLGAETLTLAIGRDNSIKFECTSPTNESFTAELSNEATFVDDPQGIVHIYEGDRLATVLDAAARDTDEVAMVVGEFGSLTILIKGHTLVAMPEANQEDDDE